MGIVYFPKTVAPISLKSDVQAFFGGDTSLEKPKLTDYLKGGSYVPNIAQNSGVPSALPLGLTDLLGSAIDFNWNVAPSNKSHTTTPSGGGTSYIDIFWQQSFDWTLLTGALHQAEIKYSVTTTFTDECTVAALGFTPDVWTPIHDASNWAKCGVRVTEIGTPPSSEASGYVTIQLRSTFDNAVVITASPTFYVFRV